MPICPKCAKEIFDLVMVQTGWEEATMVICENGTINYTDYEFEGDGQILEYKFPECHAVLFSSEDDAGEFLKLDDKHGKG